MAGLERRATYDGAVDTGSAGRLQELLAELLAAQAPPERSPQVFGGPRRPPLLPGDDHRDMMRRIVAGWRVFR